MAKKFSLLLATIAVVAFAVPALAEAEAEITVKGKDGKNGDPVVATSTNTVIKTSIGSLTCAKIIAELEVNENGGMTFILAESGSWITETCFFKGVTPITIDDGTMWFHGYEPGKGKIVIGMYATLPELTCTFSAQALPFTYSGTSDSVQIKGGLTVKPAACGTASIEGTFTLTSPLGAVVLH